MKNIKFVLIIFLFIPLFVSCNSAKHVQKEIGTIQSGLFYELTSKEYSGDIYVDVYLDDIDYSNINYFTTVKRKKALVIPLIIFNHSKEVFEITLGENSFPLIQSYREFLRDAFLAECNSSTCFNLIKETPEVPDSVFILNVKINQNVTKSEQKHLNNSFLFPTDDEIFFTSISNQVSGANSKLNLSVRLSKAGVTYFEKDYFVERNRDVRARDYGDDTNRANEACLDQMVENLSMATKEIVEQISQELNFLVLGLSSSSHKN